VVLLSDHKPDPDWSPPVADATDAWVQQIAKHHGVDLTTVGQVKEGQCDVCVGREDISSIALLFADLLCDEHQQAVISRTAEQILRPVIPEDFHEAKPSHIRAELAGWTPAVGGLYLYGETGVGKSHEAAALLKFAWGYLRRQHPDRFPQMAWRNVPIMIDDIAATFSKPHEYDMKTVREAHLLVLDDIGLADNMPFAVRKLYALLEYRLHRRLPTIVTSNMDLDQLGKHLDSPQIASRLSQMCAQVSYEGMPDRRPDLSPQLPAPEK